MNESIIKEKYLSEIIKHTVNLIKFRSVHDPSAPIDPVAPYGVEIHKALEYVLNLGKELGFKSTLGKDNKYGYIEFGTGPELFGIIAHLDVVPEGDLSKWIGSPWDPVVDEEKIFGRGSLDDKGPVIANLFALKYLKDEGYTPSKYTIRMVFGLTEETTWESITAYKENERDIEHGYVPDGQWPVIFAEKRLISFDIANINLESKSFEVEAGHVYNVSNGLAKLHGDNNLVDEIVVNLRNQKREFILDSETKKGVVTITVKGRAVHGSIPEMGDNALLHLSQTVPEKIDVELFKFINTYFSDTTSWQVKIFDNVINKNGEHIIFEDESGVISLSLSFMTFNQNVQKIGFNARVPVTISNEEFKAAIDQALTKFPNLKYHLVDDLVGKFVPQDSHLITNLMKIYTEETGDQTAQPLAIGGATFARTFDNLVAFGACDSIDSMHGVNECLMIKDLIKMFKIYTKAIRILTE